MWNSYFYNLQCKYDMRVSTKMPLVMRFDGKGVTKDKTLNLLDVYKGGFLESLKQAGWYFSNKYNCYSFLGSDELSIIFENPELVLAELDSDSDTHANEISALLSQYFFDYFNTIFKQRKVFFHGKCFSIPKEKILSYIKFRSRIIQNVMTTYFLIRKKSNVKDIKLDEKSKLCQTFSDYYVLKNIENGIIYYCGKRLDLNEFYKGNLVEIVDSDLKSSKSDETINSDVEFDIDFDEF